MLRIGSFRVFFKPKVRGKSETAKKRRSKIQESLDRLSAHFYFRRVFILCSCSFYELKFHHALQITTGSLQRHSGFSYLAHLNTGATSHISDRHGTMMLFVLILGYFAVGEALVCTPQLCEMVKNTPLQCKGSIVKGGGFCGCTDSCAKVCPPF